MDLRILFIAIMRPLSRLPPWGEDLGGRVLKSQEQVFLYTKEKVHNFNVPLSTFSWMKHANLDILKSCHRQWSTPLPVTAQDNFLTKKDKCTIAK